MAQEAHLMLGPRDGEVLSIIEPKPLIEIMVDSSNDRGYDVHIYQREEGQRRRGVFYYNYKGIQPAEKESDHDENPQD